MVIGTSLFLGLDNRLLIHTASFQNCRVEPVDLRNVLVVAERVPDHVHVEGEDRRKVVVGSVLAAVGSCCYLVVLEAAEGMEEGRRS